MNEDNRLKKKLGIKDGDSILLINAPSQYSEMTSLNETNTQRVSGGAPANFIHLFVENMNQLSETLFQAVDQAEKKAMIWISWKKARKGFNPKLNREDIRSFVLKNTNWVDTKVCSFNDEWSGLKFLRRRM